MSDAWGDDDEAMVAEAETETNLDMTPSAVEESEKEEANDADKKTASEPPLPPPKNEVVLDQSKLSMEQSQHQLMAYEHQSQQQQQQQMLMSHLHQLMPQQPVFGYGQVDPNWMAAHTHALQQYQFPIQQAHRHAHRHGHRQAAAAAPLNMEGVSLPPGIPGLGGSTDPLESVLGPFPCVKLLNLPFDATIEDILVLFQGLVILDVIILQGEAFAVFSNPMDYQMALQRDRQTIGRRFVEIKQGSRAEYYEAITTLHMKEHQKGDGGRRGDSGGSQKMTSDSSAMWGSSVSGLGSGNFFRDKDHHQGGGDHMGGRGPMGIGMGMGGGGGVGGPDRGLGPMSGVGRSGGPTVKRTGGGIQVGEHTGFLRMRGLPFSSTKEDIYKFFEGYNPVAESIVLTYRSDGRATGEAYVGFMSPDDSKRAMELHRKSMGTRYIELFISNKDEHARAMSRFGNR